MQESNNFVAKHSVGRRKILFSFLKLIPEDLGKLLMEALNLFYGLKLYDRKEPFKIAVCLLEALLSFSHLPADRIELGLYLCPLSPVLT